MFNHAAAGEARRGASGRQGLPQAEETAGSAGACALGRRATATVIVIAVGTPPEESGSADLLHVLAQGSKGARNEKTPR
jgi:hypothetical protein